MGRYESFAFLLCLIVFIAFTTLFTILITILVKQQIKLIRNGQDDTRIFKENIQKKIRKHSFVWEVIWKELSLVFLTLLILMLIFSTISSSSGRSKVEGLPFCKAVSSTSMSYKNEKNTYLIENDLNDQMQLFDLIVLHELPAEEDIKLYDVIVYETKEGILIIHRVIGIEEPNEKHPNERWFQFKGDASENYDKFPVRYEQMRSIYYGERVPNLGSFVFFMQSPAGLLCFVLVIAVMIALTVLERVFSEQDYLRIKTLVKDGKLEDFVLKPYEERFGKGGRREET